MANILVIDDNHDICLLLKRYLEKKKYSVSTAHSGKDGLLLFKNSKFDLVLCDFRLPDYDGIQLINALKKQRPACEVIVITGYSDVKMAVQVMKRGAFEYVTKPIHPEEILHSIQSALAHKSKNDKGTSSAKSKNKKIEQAFVIGKSIKADRIQKLIELVAPTAMTVVITGQSGTGKEVTAKTIHSKSTRAKERLIAVDCGAIPKEIAGSVLFGHVKGAFTGALTDKVGHFEAAHKGTLFLDEIGNLSYENQIKLLRVLQERKIQRIGENKSRPIDVRIIAATNEDLKHKVENGEFREDLYYRLTEFSIELSPLNERKEDLMLFADHLLTRASQELNKTVNKFDPEVVKIFQSYNWPGNLRELKNVIKRATLLSTTDTIKKDTIPLEIQHFNLKVTESSERNSLKLIVEKAEKKAIIKVLKETNFNKSKTAQRLEIDRKTLYNKMKLYGILTESK